MDLRIGQAWRLAGEIDRAEELLSVVTQSALNNDHLIPELYDPIDGRYEGVVPMVGYGAGAWQVAQLEKYGYGFPQFKKASTIAILDRRTKKRLTQLMAA